MTRAFVCLLLCVIIQLKPVEGQDGTDMVVEIGNYSVVFPQFLLEGFYKSLCEKMTTRTDIELISDSDRPDFYNVTIVKGSRGNTVDVASSCQYVCMKAKFNSEETEISCVRQSYRAGSFHVICENNNNNSDRCSCVDITWYISSVDYIGLNTLLPGACPDITKTSLSTMADISPSSTSSSSSSLSRHPSTTTSVPDDETITVTQPSTSTSLAVGTVVATIQKISFPSTTTSITPVTTAGDAAIDPILEQQQGDSSPSLPFPTQAANKDNTALALGVGLGSALLVVIIISVIAVILLWRKKRHLEGKVDQSYGRQVLSKVSAEARRTAHAAIGDDVSTYTDCTQVENTYTNYIDTGSEYYEIPVDKKNNKGRKAFSEVIPSSKGRKSEWRATATSIGEEYNNMENKSPGNHYSNFGSNLVKASNVTDLTVMQSATTRPLNMGNVNGQNHFSPQETDQEEDIYQNVILPHGLASEKGSGDQNDVSGVGGQDYFVLEDICPDDSAPGKATGAQNNINGSKGHDYFTLEDVGDVNAYNYDGDEQEVYELQEVFSPGQSELSDGVVNSGEAINDNTYFVLEDEKEGEVYEDDNMGGSHDIYNNDNNNSDDVTSEMVYEYEMYGTM